MWDDDINTAIPVAKDGSSFAPSGNGFCVGRGRGFGNMATLKSALPEVGVQNSLPKNSEPDDCGWDEDADSHYNQNANTGSYSWKNNNSSDTYENNSYGGKANNKGRGFNKSKEGFGSKGRGCYNCGEEGHISKECPTSGGNRSRSCHKCGEEGHISKDCPSSGGNRSRACHKCGEEGHIARDCQSGIGGGGGGASKGRTCHKCGEEGHMARDCSSGNDSRKSMACYKCHEEGHMSRDCPNAGSDSRGCFKCGEEGHMAKDCTSEPKTGADGKPRAPLYIPPEPSDDATTVFESVPAGINFSKYESIPVDVSGSRAPPPITSFASAGLNQHLLNNIKRSGYDVPTPIQKYAIPIIKEKRDLMACAQTGSGKTAAFLLPIIHNMLMDSDLSNNIDKEVQEPIALILAPTRELAIQIMSEARKFSYDSVVKAEVVYGGTSTGYQASRLRRGIHILVATPGRLNDFIEKGKISFSKLKYFVLDEADRMLDMGFMPAVEKIETTMPPKGERQTLMFSATFAEEIQVLAGKFLEDYLFITVGTVGGANTDVEQTFYRLGQYEKRQKLMDILEESGTNRVLVFVEQKRTADFLASYTSQKDIPTTSIHGDRLQKEREEALRDFRSGRMPVLVATAVAARGLDIKDVCHVINYDLPQSIDEYVHRIGRTGRVGNLGKATSFYDPDVDQPLARSLKKILMDAQQVIPDWLHEDAANAVGTVPQYSRGNFGGRDVRNQGRARNVQSSNEAWDNNYQNNEPSYSQPVEVDEIWE